MADPPPSFDELPELTLSLRSFGSRGRNSRDGALVSEEQERFFAPLLHARRQAAGATTRVAVVAAFDAPRLLVLLDAMLRAFASERCGNRDAARRAFEAELFEIAEPLRTALQGLDARAREVAGHGEASGHGWTAWIAQLRTTFRVADDSWPALRSALGGKRPELKKGRFTWRRPPPPAGDKR